MSRKTLIFVVSIVIVIGVCVIYVLFKRDDPMTSKDSSSSNKPADSVSLNSEAQPEIKGTYVDYSEALFASTKGTRLLFFYAPWCPQCRALETSIREAHLPDGVTIFKVDYDSNQSLRAKYGVTLQTTVVKVNDNGDKLEEYVAYDEPTFESVKRALLP